ncbi:LacI family DNA-binding transcriptional regulator [Actinotalea fermentans]|uniref:LacI family transcriptional regulator n=1 Tax=Actinotalea fermentans TaxID=43671 RepID=A0A511Z1F9_9CELL|nr:LacI family DNA-binding transcriptional regulator [Actinotalea fermentans]GEN81279.1 LacI family transcriptional regulator [Actinotalea fermentans]
METPVAGTTSTRPGRTGAPTIRQVAALAGVSRATASRVINGGHLVSEEARKAVEAAIAELKFVPNPVARSLATRRTGSVALIVPEPNRRLLTDPFFAGIVDGLSMALEHEGLQMVLLIARDAASARKAGRYAITGHVNGAVVASHHRDDGLNRALVSSGLPTVFIGRPLDLPVSHYVDTDNTGGARLATQHLVQRGCRRIGTIAGPGDMTAGLDRLVGWREALAAAGMPDDAVEFGDFTARSGAEAMERLLDRVPDLDAVFVANDLMASGAMLALTARGLSVPDDVAVFGFDDIGVAESTDPPLSTVVQPLADMAARAGTLLAAMLRDEPVPTEPALFSPRLVLRESA